MNLEENVDCVTTSLINKVKCALNKQLPLKDGSYLAALFNKWIK
jgi:hypothetical protein